jgi:hypothetical protein
MDLLKDICFVGDMIVLKIADGRMISAPVAWFPRLVNASDDERKSYEISPFGVHWLALDEDISLNGLLRGTSPNTWDNEAKNELLNALEELMQSEDSLLYVEETDEALYE